MSLEFVARGIYVVVTESDGTKVSINTNNITLIRDTLRGGSLIEFVGGGTLYAEETRVEVTRRISDGMNKQCLTV